MTAPQQRLRITFTKGDPVRYCSHLDLVRVWVRSLRRAQAPLAYTQGFNPRPRLQLAAALPLGHTGGAELLDVWLCREISAQDLSDRLPSALPAGVAPVEISEVPLSEPALQTRVVSAEYCVEVECEEAEATVGERIAALLSAPELPALYKGKSYDLRALVERLWNGRGDQGRVVLEMQLAAQPGRTARPEAVLAALGIEGAFARLHRRRLIFASG